MCLIPVSPIVKIKTVGDEDDYEVVGDVPVFHLGETEDRSGNQHRGDESEEGF